MGHEDDQPPLIGAMAEPEAAEEATDQVEEEVEEADEARRELHAETDRAERVIAEERRERERSEEEHPYGRPGRPLRRNTPFYIGFFGALGVFVAYVVSQAVVQARSVIVLVVVSMFIAIGLNPVVEAMTRRGVRRGLAVLVVFVVVIGAFVGLAFAVVPPAVDEGNQFVKNLPQYLQDLKSNGTINRLNNDYGVIDKLSAQATNANVGGQVFGGILGVGKFVLSTVFSVLTVLVLTLYFLSALPSIKHQAYQLFPASRRERVQKLGDEILSRIGGYVGGAATIAFIAALSTYIFLRIIDLQLALALALFVGLTDLVPLVGATIGATVVSVLGFLDSPAKGIACIIFYVVYQQIENYFIYPRVMKRQVDVPAALTVVAVLFGGALLGAVGALLAIPTAAAALLIVREVLIRRQQSA
jgi:predicted PurR-regulated permease PerM